MGKTGESCTKAVGKLRELNTSKLCGRRNTQNGQRGQRPNCPSGSENAQARRPENQNLPMKMMKAVKHQVQLKLKKKRKKKKRKKKKRRRKKRKKKRRRKKKRNKSSIDYLILQK